MSNKLLWYARRLSRMEPAELLHRVGEQTRRWQDRKRTFGWEAFQGVEGPISGLPALSFAAASETHLAQARIVKAQLQAGRVGWMGQDWPQLGADWHRTLWTLDPVSGQHWPGADSRNASYRDSDGRGDVKFVWEPNRLQMLQPLALLAAHGDQEAATLAWDIVEGWMAANPPYAGVNWTSGIEIASRIVSLLVLIGGAGLPQDASRARAVRRYLQAHARQLALYPSLYSSANNHRISELVALLLLRLSAPELKLPGARKTDLVAELEREVLNQFYADGIGAEQSPTYAAYSLEWFVLAGIAADVHAVKISETYRQRIGAAAEALRWCLDEGGHTPRLGDDDEGRVLALSLEPEVRYPASVAALAARWLGRGLPDPALYDAQLRDLIGPNANLTPEAAPQGEKYFTEGGLSVIRHAGAHGVALFTIDHGPLGFLSIAAHGHADALAVALNWGDEPVLVDAGTYLYHSGGVSRDRFRGTGSHNTLQIEDEDQSRIIGPFAWADHARTRVTEHKAGHLSAVCEGWKARYALLHERRFDWSDPQRLRIEDRLIGTASAPVNWRSGLSLAPQCRIELDGHTARIETLAGRKLILRSELSPWRKVSSVYSPAFNHSVDIDRLELAGTHAHDVSQPVAAFVIELSQ